jgi:hypothetical protein
MADKCEQIALYFEKTRTRRISRLGYVLAAKIDSVNRPLANSWGGAFNGQLQRAAVFHAVVKSCGISAIVETGTYRATTTEYIARTFSGPVYTCESNRRYFHYSRRRLSRRTNVEVRLLDSRLFLRELFDRKTLQCHPTLFYLDAHWNKDLPLVDEIELILKGHDSAVVLVDDFEVPSDKDYRYDDYGPGKRLCLALLARFRSEMENAYFPAIPGKLETGRKRGCLVFTNSTDLDQKLTALSFLRLVTEPEWTRAGYIRHGVQREQQKSSGLAE